MTPKDRRRARIARIAERELLDPFAGCLWGGVIGAVATGCLALIVFLLFKTGAW